MAEVGAKSAGAGLAAAAAAAAAAAVGAGLARATVAALNVKRVDDAAATCLDFAAAEVTDRCFSSAARFSISQGLTLVSN